MPNISLKSRVIRDIRSALAAGWTFDMALDYVCHFLPVTRIVALNAWQNRGFYV